MARGPRFLVLAMCLLLPLSGCLDDNEATADQADSMGSMRPTLGNGTVDTALSTAGRWLEPFEGEVAAVSMVLLPDERILYFSGVDAYRNDTATDIIGANQILNISDSRILDLSGPEPVITTPGFADGAGGDLFCGGVALLPDGKVMVLGGTEWGPAPEPRLVRGISDTRIFDPETNNWTLASDMLLRRWYPSALIDADGDLLAAGGIDHWDLPTEHWASWEERHATGDGNWTGIEGTEDGPVLPLYPRSYLVAGGPLKGQFFTDTSGALWAPFGEHPRQDEWAKQWAFDQDRGSWTDLGPSQFGARSYSGNVMLTLEPHREHAPKFINYGGTLYQSGIGVPFAELTDLSSDPPARSTLPNLEVPRWHPLGVLLLDGTVMALGGAQYDNVFLLGGPTMDVIHEVEIYHPDNNTWTQAAPMAVERVYHSTAVLLPDGRVLAGGHVPDPMILQPWREFVWDQIVETRFEIYEPGYLFRGARPVIVDAPDEIDYGQRFTVDVELPADLHSFRLVRPSATTHTYDGNVRHIELAIAGVGDHTYDVVAPPDSTVAPPGDYMLFALSQHPDGPVPSVAAWVHID